MDGWQIFWNGLVVVSLISVGGSLGILAYRARSRARHNRPVLRLFDRQPTPRLTREIEREFCHRCYQSGGIVGALEWLADVWDVEVSR